MARNAISNILLKITGDDTDAKKTLADLSGELQAFGAEEATAEADVKFTGNKELDEAIASLAAFSRVRATATAEVKVKGEDKLAVLAAGIEAVKAAAEKAVPQAAGDAESLSNVAAIEAAAKLLARPIKIPVETSGIKKAVTELETAELVAKRLGSTRIDLGSIVSSVGSAIGGMIDRLNSGTMSFEGFAKSGADSLKGVTVNLGLFGLKLGPTVALVLALAVAVGVSLVGALSLLVTALAGSVAAIAALGTAFVAALGPGVVLAVATITQLAKIIKVVKDLDAAKAAQDRKSAEGTKALATAEETRRQNLIAVRDATFAVINAERSYSQARSSAAEAIKNANEAQAQAQDNLRAANEDIKTETVNAYEAMAKAATDATDAMLNVKEARLSIEDAKLAVKDATSELQDFRKGTNTAGASLNSMFKKFENVNFKGNVEKGLESVGVSPKDAEKGQKLILALQHAKLQEQEATNHLTESEQDLSTARRTNNKYQKDGISAYQPLTDAIKRQKDAQTQLAKATATAARLEKQGISRNPQVVQSYQSLIQAQDRLRDARKKAAAPVGGMADDAAKAKQEFDALSPAAQKFVKVIQGAKKELSGFASAISSGVLDGLTSAAKHAGPILAALRAPFVILGDEVGTVISNIFKAFDNPAAKIQLALLVLAAGNLAKIIGGPVFINFIQLFLNVAIASMPYLVRAMQDLGKALGDVNKKASTGNGLANALKIVMGLLKASLGLIGALAKVLFAFFKDSAGDSQGFLKTLTGIANHFAAFLNSAKGRKEVHQFFADVIPLALASGRAIFAIVGFLIKVTQAVAPTATAFLNGFATVLNIISKVIGFLRPVLQYLILFAAVMVGGATGASKLAAKVLQLLLRVGVLRAGLKLFGHVASTVFHDAAHFANSAFGDIKKFASSAVHHIGSVFGTVGHLIAQGFRKGVHFAEGLYKTFYNVGKNIVLGLANGIASIGKTLLNAGKKAGSAVIKGAKGILHINSPSKVFHEIGTGTVEGLSNGLLASRHKLAATVNQTIAPVVKQTKQAVHIKAPKLGIGEALNGAGHHTSVGDIILQTAGGGTPDGYTAARQIQRQMKNLGG